MIVEYEIPQPYKYNGKELDRMYGLDWYDYGARSYDAALMNWFRMYRYAEKTPHLSPYIHCANNPNSQPEITVFEVTQNYYDRNGNYGENNFVERQIEESPSSLTWHGIGHVLYQGKGQDKVIKFENFARKQLGLPLRKPDDEHNYLKH